MKLELNIPETLNDITLGQYQKFSKIEEPTNEDLLAIFLNIDYEVINYIPLAKIDDIVNHINSLFEQEPKHQLKFKMDGVRYGFIPDLDSITYGENKDVTRAINDWETMHEAIAVLYRPITHSQGGKYLIEEYNGTRFTSDKMRKTPLSVVMGAMVFFYNLTNELLKAIPSYLQNALKREQMSGQISAENGATIRKSLHSLEVTLCDLMKLQKSHYTSA